MLSLKNINIFFISLAFLGGICFLVNSAGSAQAQDLCPIDVDIVLIMDRSGSMSYEVPSRLEQAQAAASQFIGYLGSSDQSGLVSFATGASLDKTLSSDHSASQAAVSALTAGGATNIGDAIAQASLELNSARANPQANKIMILLTDGLANKPNGSGYGEDARDVAFAEDMAQQAGDLGFKIFTIGLGNTLDINETMLQNIAALTGGQYFHAPTCDDLEAVYQTIAQEVCQYGSISGCKYQDANNDGVITGEETLSGWEIVLGGDSQANQLTDDQGCYTFAGLLPGNYSVLEGENLNLMPFAQTYPETYSYNINLAEGENRSQIDFGNYLPLCGNNILDPKEECDDGNLVNADGCSDVCLIELPPEPVCGNQILETGEQCDDGNLINGDGCSDVCQIEEIPLKDGDIVINEIMQNPDAVSDTAGEWFEVYNATDQAIGLAGCSIRDNGSDDHLISSSLIVPAKGYAVLARNSDPALNGGLTPDYVYSSFTLGNSDDEIILECQSQEIDRVEYDGGPNFPDPTGVSMILADPFLDNNLGANWCVSTSVYGDGDLGSPGILNDVCGQEPEPVCGNEVLEGDEQCDDGNLINGDGCSNICLIELPPEPVCGNQILEAGEQCDDGNIQDGDGCSALCQLEQVPVRQISGCKYYDRNNNSLIDQDEEQLSDWLISLKKYEADQWLQTATTTTQQIGEGQGCYLFSDLSPGIYQVSETLPASADWLQTYPLDPHYWQIDLTLGTATTTADFLNYLPLCGNNILDHSEQCDDGNLVNGDGCSNVCLIEKAPEPPTRGESGGSSVLVLTIFNEAIKVAGENSAGFSWQTNYPATSQIIYSIADQDHLLDTADPPYYGYALGSPKYNEKTTTHNLDLTDLVACATYYCRFVSTASSPAFSKELTFTTDCPSPEIVFVPPVDESTQGQEPPPQDQIIIARPDRTQEEPRGQEPIEEPEEPTGEEPEPLVIAPQEPSADGTEEEQETGEVLSEEEFLTEEEQDKGFFSSLLAAIGNLFKGVNIGWLIFLIILLSLIIYAIIFFVSRKKEEK